MKQLKEVVSCVFETHGGLKICFFVCLRNGMAVEHQEEAVCRMPYFFANATAAVENTTLVRPFY